MKKLLVVLVIGFSLYGFLENPPSFTQSYSQQITSDDQQVTRAFQNRQSDLQVGGFGIVVRNLPDDTNRQSAPEIYP